MERDEKSVDIQENEMEERISEGLKGIQLDLNFNNIGEEGAKYIGEALLENTTLKKLNLLGNNIGDEGANYIGEALLKNTTLKELNLLDNNIGGEGAKYIGDALLKNTTLKVLSLRYNNIAEKGVKRLISCLEKNYSLVELKGYRFDDAGKFLERNKKGIELARRSALYVICIKKFRGRKPHTPFEKIHKDCIPIIAKMVWKTAGQKCWIREDKKRRRRRTKRLKF